MAWGNPIDNANPKIPYSYQSAPLYGKAMPFDVYMVGGRYRVVCFCPSMLHAMDRGGGHGPDIVRRARLWP